MNLKYQVKPTQNPSVGREVEIIRDCFDGDTLVLFNRGASCLIKISDLFEYVAHLEQTKVTDEVKAPDVIPTDIQPAA